MKVISETALMIFIRWVRWEERGGKKQRKPKENRRREEGVHGGNHLMAAFGVPKKSSMRLDHCVWYTNQLDNENPIID